VQQIIHYYTVHESNLLFMLLSCNGHKLVYVAPYHRREAGLFQPW
jgi:hypothetical protein